ncbi:precorrin-6y C5,15-methyltransferase (decarboxylating) subunit CbiE [Streptomyces sp. L2]|uniref:precorrin-6y C5,15-methyltransferase (decarboxylating) subunit CbiE n=1 Tax=Streptomyces sp. L2 TaxID=2162665 RepID=UPI0010128FC3|nr:precorrin-6y C5,15-methyltransferase (decarboxylating) subunit CbiE [Streptomyces sp. L2]
MITVVGTGTGGAPPSPGVCAGAALVVGGRRHLDAVALPEGAERIVLGPLAPALDAMETYVGKDLPVVVLASGDPGFFGIVRALAERFGAGRLDVRPGVSSVAAAFARVGLPWDDAVVVSAHGRDLRTAVNLCRAHPKVAVLTGPGAGPAELGAALSEGGVPGEGRVRTEGGVAGEDQRSGEDHQPGRGRQTGVGEVPGGSQQPGYGRQTGTGQVPGGSPRPGGADRVLVVATALGDPERERVERVTPAEAAGRDWGAAVSVVLCLDEERALGPVRTVAGVHAPPARWALEEDAFAHRDSMITKFEVRALALARLGPRPGDLVWDVGAGSGSVAVECARLGAAVVAVEKTADGVERIRANARAHGVDVRTVHGAAPDVLSGLADDPDAVFVGGGGRELPGIVAACARRARRAVVVAMAALDRVPAAREALTSAGLACDGVLLQSSRLAPLPGEVSRLAATNPVFLLWGERTPVSDEGVAQ